MPTENRSTMVSVPRELLERIDRMYTDDMSIFGECEEVRALLAQPAQHQGEPVAHFDLKELARLKDMKSGYMGCYAYRDPGALVTPLYTHPAPAVQQEPVTPAFVMPSNENSYGFGYVDGTCIQSLRGYRDHLEEIVDSIPEGPLYTHADPGEVERLRGEINKWETRWQEETANVGALRAQLAETQTLLLNVVEACEYGQSLYEVKEIALSVSAEPTTECAHSYANKLGCPECGEAFGSTEPEVKS